MESETRYRATFYISRLSFLAYAVKRLSILRLHKGKFDAKALNYVSSDELTTVNAIVGEEIDLFRVSRTDRPCLPCVMMN